ncbi:MAG: hypothetical protein ABJ327_16500 [Litoreibacter sp.]
MARILFLKHDSSHAVAGWLEMTRENSYVRSLFSGSEAAVRFVPVTRTGDAIDRDLVPPSFRVSTVTAHRVSDFQTDVTPEIAGDFIDDGHGNLFVSGRFRELLLEFDEAAADFIEIDLLEGRTKEPLPGDWFLMVIRKQANVIQEDRSELLSLASHLSGIGHSRQSPKLLAYQSDVEGFSFWSGQLLGEVPLRTGRGRTPVEVSNPRATYCSEAFWGAMEAAGLSKYWMDFKIEELPDEDKDTQGQFSPLALRQRCTPIENAVTDLLVSSLSTMNKSGEVSRLSELLAEPAPIEADVVPVKLYLDDDLPILGMDLFEFRTFLFCSGRFREALGAAEAAHHTFVPVEFYSDPELTQKRPNAIGHFGLSVRTLSTPLVLALSDRVGVELGMLGPKISNPNWPNEVLAFDASAIDGAHLWRQGWGRKNLIVSSELVQAFTQAGLVGIDVTSVSKPVVWEGI